MALFMLLATLWCVVQLAVFAWVTRSMRLSTLALLIPVGVYGCGVVVAGMQIGFTRAWAEWSDEISLTEAVRTTSYTVGPISEEIVKLLPLLIAGATLRIRRQWGLTDYVIGSAAIGAGFALLEAVLRGGGRADSAVSQSEGGWVLTHGFGGAYVPGPKQIALSLFPSPTWSWDVFSFSAQMVSSPHVLWSALAGLGVGVALRAKGKHRLLGLAAFAAACAHHMSRNYLVFGLEPGADEPAVLRPAIDAIAGITWLLILVILATAVVSDLRVLKKVKGKVPGLLLGAERSGRSSVAALASYALLRPWDTLVLVWRFVLVRRKACYGTDARRSTEALEGSLLGDVETIRDRMDAIGTKAEWRAMSGKEARAMVAHVMGAQHRPASRRQVWLIIVPLVLSAPALAYLILGGFPQTSGIQEALTGTAWFAVMLVCGALSLVWLAWRFVVALRVIQARSHHPIGEILATAGYAAVITGGAFIAGVALLALLLTGVEPVDDVVASFYLLEQLEQSVYINVTAMYTIGSVTIAHMTGETETGSEEGGEEATSEDGSERQGTLPPGHTYHNPPERLKAFPDAVPARPKGPRKTWKDSKGNTYEWDRRHGTVEKYTKKGKHLGDFNPKTGKQVGGPKPRRPQGS